MTKERSVFLALMVSLVLNAGFAGFVAARLSGGDDVLRPLARQSLNELGLVQRQQQKMRRLMGKRSEEMRERAKELRTAQRQAAKILRQSQFKEDELRGQFEEIRRIHAESEQALQESLIELARGMSPRERKMLAALVEKRTRQQRQRQRQPRKAPSSPDGSQ